MSSLVHTIGLSIWLVIVCSAAENLPLIRQSNLFEVQGAEGEGSSDATGDVADWSGGARARAGEASSLEVSTRTLDIEAIGGNPTASPTPSTQPSLSIVPSLAPTSSIRPSMSRSPSASQAPSINVPRGAALVGQGVCADSTNERYSSLGIEASVFKDGFSAQLCLEKCLSLSFITQLHLRGFEFEQIDDALLTTVAYLRIRGIHVPVSTTLTRLLMARLLMAPSQFLSTSSKLPPNLIYRQASFPGLSTHVSAPVINDSTECLNLTVSILTPQVTRHGLYLSWGLYGDSECVDTPDWLDGGGDGSPKLWGEKSILITPNNTFDCVDTPNWEDKDGKGCDAYKEFCPDPSEASEEFLRHAESIRENCCACGGGTTSLRSNSIIIRNAIESNVCLAKDETYRFQVRAHGWTSADDTLGHSAVAYALSSHDNQIACGQFDIIDVEDTEELYGGFYLVQKLQSNFTTIVTVDPTNNTHTGCTALDGRDIGRGIELLPLKCYYDSQEDGLFTRNNAWKGTCSETYRLDSSCSSAYSMGLDESEGYCKFEEYHKFVSDVSGGVPFSPLSAQGECLWEVWDHDFGSKDPARIDVAACCRSGLGSEGDLMTLFCECSLLKDCGAGKGDKCSAYAAVCCEDASCKCDYKRRACLLALEKELATGDEAAAGDVCQEAESSCSFGQEPSIGGYECDFWEPLCRELPNSKSACRRSDEVCCGSGFFSNPHCTCDFLTFAIDELGYEDTESNRTIICAKASTLDSSKSTEKQSLMNLYKSTDGLNWLNSKGWHEEESDHCSWVGISCNPDGHVNEINLHANNLSGSFPARLLSGLTHLERIDLADNKLSGQMSAYVVDDRPFWAEGMCLDANGMAYGFVSRLLVNISSSAYEDCYDLCQDISTNDTDLVGLQTDEWEPGVFDCACLYDYGTLPHADPVYFLEIDSDVESTESCNQACEDAVPESSTVTLVDIFFYDYGFCSCYYDEEFAGTALDGGGLINGRLVYLIDDFSEGAGPVASAGDPFRVGDGKCYPLHKLPSYNDFASLSSLRKLKHIDISNNQLSGQFDALLAPSLEYLNASQNNFTSLSRFRSYKPSHKTLRTLDLSTNYIRQNLSMILSNVPPNLVQISFANNTIRGSFPTTLDSLESLQQLDISSNVISGSLPDFSRSCPSLQALNLSDNARTNDTGLTGDVPAGISNLAFLQELHLRNNQLSGGLAGLGGMPQIKELDLSVNRFAGTVPAELGSLAGEQVVGVPILHFEKR
ncbi:hypothetical protein THAOC_20276 [Thalassiosira oceanica]|uniref:Leucine-rich repeat-containing N-terminal plant-type domain-containing protein n=1 Tax=Thalassiosira oceanica TaxID=159749 RepID=K0SLZ8_THAOC|nr:hypothetical protein THAOC_20276 [Thalassiosira oceanica]|eukprot:EJK59492.1 hypothetical protein THAOC_20276 [Thalassiosira oceanica]